LPAGHRAVSVLYQALLTGLVLTLVTRRGEAQAAEFVFRLFRRQHREKFRPGLAKRGLDRLPHAVACAQYHYLSNQLGGVKTEYARESDRKAWVSDAASQHSPLPTVRCTLGSSRRST